MSQKLNKYGKLITHSRVINEDTGEYFENESVLDRPDVIQIIDKKHHFVKLRLRLINSIEPREIGYLLVLINGNIDYYTGRLRLGGVGKQPIAIKSIKQISEIINVNRKTAGRLIKGLIMKKIVIKIGVYYHINPLFVQYGNKIETDTFLEMIKHDIELINHIPKTLAKVVSYYRRVG